jgi:hypothetical protein
MDNIYESEITTSLPLGQLPIMTNTWIFYGTDHSGIKTIHHIKQCKRPEATSEYKEMMHLLENNTYYTTGYMTSKAWNKDHQYIKVI